MGYYIRVFCVSKTVPSVGSVAAALQAAHPSIRLRTEHALDSVDWKHVELHYKDGKKPVLVEINRNEGEDSLASEEASEFAEEVSGLAQSSATARVIEHLRASRYTVCCQLLSDIDQDGFEANGRLLDHFVVNHRGIIQADGEGFYDGTDILLELE